MPFRVHDGRIEIQGGSYALIKGEYTPWIRLKFGRAHGIVRFLLTNDTSEIELYATPVQIDPENPALPISHPAFYAIYLAKLLGTYSTLGLAEDTSALNEGAIGEDEFLQQARLIQEEREAMFFSALERTRHGVVACVFDTTDRVQHMFHGQPDVIEPLYCDMDRIVGKTLAHVDADTAVFVLSDHGFCGFRRGVNLNSWLLREGYLVLDAGRTESGEYLEGIDWANTRAYTFGLSGVYLNLRGREAQGIVTKEEALALKDELVRKLTGLRDEDATAIQAAYQASDIYRGPYLDAAPDLIIGYAEGYRAAWDAATGRVTSTVFEDNRKAWCGDHCVDPPLVPGVLFSNLRITADDPGIEDLAPTALSLFGVGRARVDGRQIGHCGGVNIVCWLHCTLLAACGTSHYKKVIVIGVDGMDPVFVERHWADLPNLHEAARARQLLTSRNNGPAAESGGMVDIHYRTRPGGARHFRFRASRSGHAGAISLDR